MCKYCENYHCKRIMENVRKMLPNRQTEYLIRENNLKIRLINE